jgi:2-isopropylmalate synthase
VAGPRFGVGIHSNILTASVLAVISAVNRAFQGLDAATRRQVLSGLEATPSAA